MKRNETRWNGERIDFKVFTSTNDDELDYDYCDYDYYELDYYDHYYDYDYYDHYYDHYYDRGYYGFLDYSTCCKAVYHKEYFWYLVKWA